jgi:hypothetical protein
MKHLYLLAIALLCLNAVDAQTRKLAAIGSSTTGGTGAWPIDSSWLKRVNFFYKHTLHQLDSVYTHGVGGYSCYKGMPTNFAAPANRPAPDPGNNISVAISKLQGLEVPSNGVIIVNYPSNEYHIYTIAEIMKCLQTIYDSAVEAGHKCFITTTQPRTDGVFGTSDMKRKLAVIKDSVINRFGIAHTLNFWDGIINPADTSILPAFAAGDNIHLNNAGHRELFARVVAKDVFNLVPQVPLPITIEQFSAGLTNAGVELKWAAHHDEPNAYFVVQRSNDGVSFESLARLDVHNSGGGRQSYRYEDVQANGTVYYRLRVHEAARTYYSAVISVKVPLTHLIVKRLYPTRIRQSLTLEIISPQIQSATFEIISSNGTRLKLYTRQLHRNSNIITLPVPALSQGLYFLRVSSPGRRPVIQSFLK